MPSVVLLGYTLVALGLSAITGPVVSHYTSGSVTAAFVATCAVSIVLSIAGILYPRSLESLGGYLFGGLLALIFVRVGQLILVSLGMYQYGFISLVEISNEVSIAGARLYPFISIAIPAVTLKESVICGA